MGKKCTLIIGGCGYAGSRLYLHLKKSGYPVDTIDLEWFGNYVNSDNILMDYRDCDASFYRKYDVIILLAGHSSVPMCLNNGLACFKNNVANFVGLLEKIIGCRFIYMSSSSIYGNVGEKAVTEEWNEYVPTNHYDLSKKEIDMYAALSGLDYYGLRMGTVNGPSVNFRTDIMINKMYHSAWLIRSIFVTNPHIYRPILGIDDFCRAVVAILEGPIAPGVYNLASVNVKVSDIANAVSKVLGVPAEYKGETPSYNFSIDTTKFCKTFNFQFTETVDSIVLAIKKEFGRCNSSDRTKVKDYV